MEAAPAVSSQSAESQPQSQSQPQQQPQSQPPMKQPQSSPLQQQQQQQQAQAQAQQSSTTTSSSSSTSNPNPNLSQPANRIQFNRQPPSWVTSPQQPAQFSLLPSPTPAIAIGVPANSSQPAANAAVYSVSADSHSMLPHHRPVRPPNPLPTSQTLNFQGHGIVRASSAALPSTSTPTTTSQPQPSSHQPWLSAQHGRPPIRPQPQPQPTSQIVQQQKSHIPQQLMPPTSHSHQFLSSPTPQPQPQPQHHQHFPPSILSQDNSAQQFSSSRNPQPQQHPPRVLASPNHRPPSPIMPQPGVTHSARTDNNARPEPLESCTRILSKRNIQELVNQVDPLEKLDSEVEDVLVDIADDFIDSVTQFGCSLAKHRKSITLEAKDILLHVERTWNMTLPGFSGDEIKTYKKPVVNETHKERIAMIKRNPTGAEVNKSSAGQAVGNVKGHLAKATPNVIGS